MIRNFKSSDITRIKKLVPEKIYWNFFEDQHYVKFVADYDKTIAGILALSIKMRTANVHMVFVREDFRGQGVGKELMEKAEAYVESKRLNGLCLYCSKHNKKLQRMCKKSGYKKVGKVRNYLSDNDSQIFFWKRIFQPSYKI